MYVATIKFEEMPLLVGSGAFGRFDGEADIDIEGDVVAVRLLDDITDVPTSEFGSNFAPFADALRRSVKAHCEHRIYDAQIDLQDSRADTAADAHNAFWGR